MKRTEIVVHYLLGFLVGNVHALSQPESLHSVDEPVRDGFSSGALLKGDFFGRCLKHPRRHSHMHIVSSGEGCYQPGIVRQMRYTAQFYLVVVGHHQHRPFGGHESSPKLPPLFCADGNVVKVGRLGTQPASACAYLVEVGVDAPIVFHFFEQTFAVGGAQLFHLSVFQEEIYNVMLASQFLQSSGIGRRSPLGLLQRNQA